MPGFNRKGPEGEGPMTGRGRGKCGSSKAPDKEMEDSQDCRRQRRRLGRSAFSESQKGKRGRGNGRRFRGGFGES